MKQSLNKCLQKTALYLASNVVRTITTHQNVILRKPFVTLVLRRTFGEDLSSPKAATTSSTQKKLTQTKEPGGLEQSKQQTIVIQTQSYHCT